MYDKGPRALRTPEHSQRGRRKHPFPEFSMYRVGLPVGLNSLSIGVNRPLIDHRSPVMTVEAKQSRPVSLMRVLSMFGPLRIAVVAPTKRSAFLIYSLLVIAFMMTAIAVAERCPSRSVEFRDRPATQRTFGACLGRGKCCGARRGVFLSTLTGAHVVRDAGVLTGSRTCRTNAAQGRTSARKDATVCVRTPSTKRRGSFTSLAAVRLLPYAPDLDSVEATVCSLVCRDGRHGHHAPPS
jgi:hypothetical protein